MPTRLSLRVALILLALAGPLTADAQVQVIAPARSTSLDRELVSFGFGLGGEQVLPPFVTRVNPLDGSVMPAGGDMQVLLKDGKPMLRATARVALLITLPEALPADFTLEFDIVPKPCCQPEDLSFEGKRAIDQGPQSANVLWHHERLEITGGGGNTYSAPLPAELQEPPLAGKPTRIVFEARGDQMRMFANGTQILDLPKKIFARTDKVLRVTLGGDPSEPGREVFLSHVRISTPGGASATPAPAIATAPPPGPLVAQPVAPTTGTATPIQPPPVVAPAPNAERAAGASGVQYTGCDQLKTGGPGPSTVKSPSGTPVGAYVSWTAVPNSRYIVERATAAATAWTLIGSSCGGPMPLVEDSNGFSVMDQTGHVSVMGTYIYRVTAVGPNGEAGWNTVRWLSPNVCTPKLRATVSGSTVTLSWEDYTRSCGGTSTARGPDYFAVTSSYGYSTEVSVTQLKVYGVPVGNHSFRVVSHWRPDGKSGTAYINVEVKY